MSEKAAPGRSLRDRGYERLIVDGMNALGSRPDGWWRDRPRAMARLLGRLQPLAGPESGLAVEVVFDGRPHERVLAAAAAIDVSFAGSGADAADREIAARVRASERPGGVLVISSDRRLVAAVKAAGGSSLGSGAFLHEWVDDS